MKKNLIILNPCSGKKKANKYLTQIVDVFTHAGYMSTVLTTTQRGDGILYAGKYGGKYDLITCIGGDGTFNEVVAGLMKKGQPKRCGSNLSFHGYLNMHRSQHQTPHCFRICQPAGQPCDSYPEYRSGLR